MHLDNKTNLKKHFETYFSQYEKLIVQIVEDDIKNKTKSYFNEKKVYFS